MIKDISKHSQGGLQQTPPEPVALVWKGALSKQWLAQLRENALLLADLCGDSPRSFWLDATAEPRTSLEAYAMQVLEMHLPHFTSQKHVGVEFWVHHWHRSTEDADTAAAQQQREPPLPQVAPYK